MFDPHKFWENPDESSNYRNLIRTCRPEFYLDLENVTRLNVGSLLQYTDQADSVLEIGSGTGRNLVGLYKTGYRNLSGIELSQRTIDVGRSCFPELEHIEILCSPIEDADFGEYDAIFTSGLLMHLPPASEFVFDRIRERARKVIMTTEGEDSSGIQSWTRNYQKVFEQEGWKQAEWRTCEKFSPLPMSTIQRIFVCESRDS